MDSKLEVSFINFQKNWNHKLNCDYFCTIRPRTYNYTLNQKYQVRLDDRFLFDAILIDIKEMTINQLIIMNYHLLAGGKPEKDFYNFMEALYSKEKWWYEKNTTMKLLFFQKITQLNLFDS